MKTKEEILKELRGKYGFNKASYRYIPAGSEILKYINQVVILIDYTKENDEWKTETHQVVIKSISDFDIMTMTYLLKYQHFTDEDTEVKEIRIIPEGYSWGNPEETGTMKRFLPYSMHCQLVEDEMFFSRLKDLWEERNTIPVEGLKTISDSLDKASVLKYQHNIGALIKLNEGGDLLWIRITSLRLVHKVGTKYSLKIGDDKQTWSLSIDSSDTEYNFESDLGKVKIVDLACLD